MQNKKHIQINVSPPIDQESQFHIVLVDMTSICHIIPRLVQKYGLFHATPNISPYWAVLVVTKKNLGFWSVNTYRTSIILTSKKAVAMSY